MALVGADEGLFAMDLTSAASHQLSPVKGPGGVFQITLVESLGIAVMITG